jgi:ribosome-binding ATPase YchF (GTP1/OBG family)
MVVPTFSGADPKAELASFAEDLLFTDMDIVLRRIEKLEESIKKPRPNKEQEAAELAALQSLQAQMERGGAVGALSMTEEQRRATRSFRLFAEKPRLVVFNLSDGDADQAALAAAVGKDQPFLAAPLELELELSKMPEADRAEFERDLNLATPRRDEFLRKILDVSHQILFFTAGDKEVRTWLLPQGGTALDAAGNIHTDLARGFIRAEVMRSEDLIRLGSEREIKAHNLLRHEHKDYQVQEGDVVLIRHSG